MSYDFLQLPSPLQELEHPLLHEKSVRLFLKRDDLIHAEISGNKWRKLSLNIAEARLRKFDTVLTFGGAFSNHIAATASVGRLLDIKTIGVIRGEELHETWKHNATLAEAAKAGMQLHFVSREQYAQKQEADFIDGLHQKFGPFWLVPEGGANFQGMMGCMEIVKEIDVEFDFVCAPIGTGTTIAGLLAAVSPSISVLGFQALKGEGFRNDIGQLLYQLYWNGAEVDEACSNLRLMDKFTFGGYAKVDQQLLDFMTFFYQAFDIQLDQVYTAKMLFGLWELIKEDYFTKGSSVIAVHTGGIQGNTRWKAK